MAEEYEVLDMNPVSRMVDYVTQAEYQKANDLFNEILSQRVADSLDQEKIAIAQSIYQDEESGEDEEEEEFTDEELEDALEEVEDEEDEED